MCKPPLLIFFAISCTRLMAQQTTPAPVLSGEDYLKKAKGQNTAAWVLAGAGTVFISTGAAIGFGEAMNSLASIFSSEPETYNNTGDVLFYTGLVMLGGSIPFFIAAGKNKRRANGMGASFKLEERWQPGGMAMTRKYYPALSLRFPVNSK